MNIDNNVQIALWLTMMHGQQSLTLRSHLFSTWGSEHVTITLSYKGSQHFVYDCLQPVPPRLPKIQDQQSLMLILKMGQGQYCNLFYL